MKIPHPPKSLKSKGREFWKRINTQYVITEEAVLQRLEMAGSCLDEISDSEEILKKKGRFIKDRYGSLRENPAAKAIRESKIIFCRIIRELGFDIEGGQESRPPRQY